MFLDRDGVLNEIVFREGKPYPPSSVAELRLPVGAGPALETLAAAHLVLIGVTNQPDVARRTQTRAVVEAINAAILATLPLREILVCYHDDADDCDCRKPKPGLLLRGAASHSVDLSRSFLVGDRWKDIEAGHRAGCTTILLGDGYGEIERGRLPHYCATSLSDAATWILESSTRGSLHDQKSGALHMNVDVQSIPERIARVVLTKTVSEAPFRSSAPIVGPLIVRFRELWNSVSTTWYVRPILQQQNDFNEATTDLMRSMADAHAELRSEVQALAKEVELAIGAIEPTVIDIDQSMVRTNVVLAKLDLRLRRLEKQLSATETNGTAPTEPSLPPNW